MGLTWGGADCRKLAETFGTPLYVYDAGIIKARCRELRTTFLERWPNTSVHYAGKAFLTRATARLIADEGLGLDVVSGGEMYTAFSADFPPERIEFNGNAKSREELDMAVRSGVGRIIVDHADEIPVIEHLAEKYGRVQNILIRVAPGVDAHTHKAIATGQTDSKFGFPAGGKMLTDAISSAQQCGHINLTGLHFHVGSQLFDNQDYVMAVNKTLELVKALKDEQGFITHELNMGGGFGAVISPDVPAMRSEFYTDIMMKTLIEGCERLGLEVPHVILEPGRWIVSEAGITLYRVENIKELSGVTYIAVNGGMADNPRIALYGAEYVGVNIDEPHAKPYNREGNTRVSVVGKCCESGDVLIEDAKLPYLKAGDIIALYNSGAYTFSMASNYNCLPRPAVVFVENGDARLVVERQSMEELIRGQYL
ncbi:MAG: diaminopimelate decarboxylase [Synergistaceae bacterium]|nr:diaminopimelate decarboxylase [Synergistaceae bacterium]